ncbi:MAG TPA: hypothetical protein VJH68_01110 [Candidatus Nanoarchaeia archaeon]|nr:hypothetical protein [Candidatus Nanoarchaeia archaeon]
MVIRSLVGGVSDRIPVKTVLISVFDKTGLDAFVPELIKATPNILFLSTGGTYKTLQRILDNDRGKHLMEVSEYTGFPEMEGGLVKTLHPRIHAGILGERNNPAHQIYLESLGSASFIDLVIVNLYPFEQVIAKPDLAFEEARGNIDIGGPTMVRGAAKNFPSCAVIIDPKDYAATLQHLQKNGGCTTLNYRLSLMPKAFAYTAKYDEVIADFMANQAVGNKTAVLGRYGLKR